ncbi:MAG TPA: DUF4115 domain-containing protein, partial [Burkholderiales bacterium]
EGLKEYRPRRMAEQQTAPVPAPSPPPEQPARAPEPPPPVIEAVVQPAPLVPPQAVTASRVLVMSFSAESWVEVRNRDGRVIFSQKSPAGSSQSVEGDPPLAVVVGNAAGVQVTYGDQPVDIARFTRENIARFTLE